MTGTPHEPCPQTTAHGTHEWYQDGVLRRQCPGQTEIPMAQPPARVGVLTWDWREQPDIGDLADIIRDLSEGRIHLTQVGDTGSDQHAVVVSTVPVDQATARQVFKRWWVSDDRADVFLLPADDL